MSTETNEPAVKSKAELIIECAEAALPPSLRGKFRFTVIKDNQALTKVRADYIIPERANEGTVVPNGDD